MTWELTHVIATFQIASANSLTRSGLRVPARPQSIFVSAKAHDRHLNLTFRMRQFTYFEFFRLNFPRTGRSKVLIDDLHLDSVVAFGRARMLASSRIVRQQTLLHTGGAVVHVAFMLVRVVTFRWELAWELAFRWFRLLFAATGYSYCRLATSVSQFKYLVSRIIPL